MSWTYGRFRVRPELVGPPRQLMNDQGGHGFGGGYPAVMDPTMGLMDRQHGYSGSGIQPHKVGPPNMPVNQSQAGSRWPNAPGMPNFPPGAQGQDFPMLGPMQTGGMMTLGHDYPYSMRERPPLPETPTTVNVTSSAGSALDELATEKYVKQQQHQEMQSPPQPKQLVPGQVTGSVATKKTGKKPGKKPGEEGYSAILEEEPEVEEGGDAEDGGDAEEKWNKKNKGGQTYTPTPPAPDDTIYGTRPQAISHNIKKLIEGGMTEAEARREVIKRIGGREYAKRKRAEQDGTEVPEYSPRTKQGVDLAKKLRPQEFNFGTVVDQQVHSPFKYTSPHSQEYKDGMARYRDAERRHQLGRLRDVYPDAPQLNAWDTANQGVNEGFARPQVAQEYLDSKGLPEGYFPQLPKHGPYRTQMESVGDTYFGDVGTTGDGPPDRPEVREMLENFNTADRLYQRASQKWKEDSQVFSDYMDRMFPNRNQ